MKIISRYVLSSYFMSFVITCSVMMLVMSLAGSLKLTDLFAKGAPLDSLGELFLLGIPQILVFAIPMSAMICTMLVFGSLSSDGEITAMRSCGISPWTIISRPALFSVLLVALCLYLANVVVPASHYAARVAISDFLRMKPEAVLEEGRFVETVPGLSIYVRQKEGASFDDIKIYDTREPGFTRKIWARSGSIVMDEQAQDLMLHLRDVRVDPFSRTVKGTAFSEKWVVGLGLSRGAMTYRRKPVDFSAGEVIAAIQNPANYFPNQDEATLSLKRTQLIFDLHERMILALSCLIFTLVGFPLAVRAHRKESSIGVAMSLGVILLFHLFVVAAESLDRHRVLAPLILWAPIALGLLLAWKLVKRIT